MSWKDCSAQFASDAASRRSPTLDSSLTSCNIDRMSPRSIRLPTLSAKERLLLDFLAQEEELYGLQLVAASKRQLKRGPVYVTLQRLEAKGSIVSRPADAPGGAG